MTSSEPITRGFLFADLRGYTQYVEQHGDAAAATLLTAYRRLVRGAVERSSGAEIRTEGDSFFVIFPSASRAVQCGLDIVAAAAEGTQAEGQALRVGIGVHAGETATTDEGPVGSAINIAARVCAVAGPNEVLVTEIVRALTRTTLAVRFVPRGSPRLKGIAEPMPLYRVEPGAASAMAAASGLRVSRTRLRGPAFGLAVVTIAAVLVAAVAAVAASGSLRGTSAGAAGSSSPGAALGLTTEVPSTSPQPAAPSVLAPSAAATAPPASASPTASGSPSTGPGPSATVPTAGGTFPRPDEAILLSEIPPEIAKSCGRASAEQGGLTLVAVRCDLPLNSDADTVWWDVFDNHSLVTQEMDTLSRAAKLSSGTCSTKVKAAYGKWQLGDTFSGRLACWQDSNGAWIAWSYFDQQLTVRAFRRDADWAALYAWWQDTAGYLHPSN